MKQKNGNERNLAEVGQILFFVSKNCGTLFQNQALKIERELLLVVVAASASTHPSIRSQQVHQCCCCCGFYPTPIVFEDFFECLSFFVFVLLRGGCQCKKVNSYTLSDWKEVRCAVLKVKSNRFAFQRYS